MPPPLPIRHILESMSITQVVDTLLTRPVVHIACSGRDTGMTASYSFRPLSNLIYTRDQQITTCKGVVMARLRSQQRQDEVSLMKYVVSKIGKTAPLKMAPSWLLQLLYEYVICMSSVRRRYVGR